MATSRTRNITCRVHPLVVSTVLDAYIRRQEGNEKCIGALMGYIDGNCLVISDAFMVLHKENEENGTLSLDKEYHRKMVVMKKKVCPTENVVGWFATCDEIEPSFVPVHSFFSTPAESKFVPSQLMSSPVLLTVDPSLSNGDLNIKVSVMQTTVGADSLVQFHQLSTEVDTNSASVMQFVRNFSQIAAGSNSESIKEDIATVASAASNDASVSVALQQLKTTGADLSDLKSMVKTHLGLVDRVSAVINQPTQDIVI